MTEEILAVIRDEIKKSIEVTVNGNIRGVKEMLQHQNEKQEEFNKMVEAHIEKADTHMEVVEPYLQGAAGLRLIWKGLVAIAVGWVALKSGFLIK